MMFLKTFVSHTDEPWDMDQVVNGPYTGLESTSGWQGNPKELPQFI